MQDTTNIYEEDRPWGKFRKFTENALSTVKIITVNPNKKLSLQSHQKRGEFWKVIEGSGIFEINKIKYDVKKGDEKYIPQGTLHRIEALSEEFVILEISTGEFDESDIKRFEDEYGRV
jgi:mannose-6-phosphate isomerase-like protein (cupin superfamily)